MSWTKIIVKGGAFLAVSLSPALKASESPARRVAPPCGLTVGLNEGRHRRRVWQQANRAALEQPVASAASLAGLGFRPEVGSDGSSVFNGR